MSYVSNIPVIGAARTLLDLCVSAGSTDCERAMDTALREGLVTIEDLRLLVESASERRLAGTKALRALVDVRGNEEALSESELESRVLRLLRGANYRLPECQVEMQFGDRPGRVDFFYPDADLVIEVDGRKWHAGRLPEIRDRQRDHALGVARIGGHALQ
jgi:hypothetical protein